MEFTKLKLQVLSMEKIIGDENASISGVSPIENAEKDSFLFVSQEKFADYIFHQTHLLLLFLRSL